MTALYLLSAVCSFILGGALLALWEALGWGVLYGIAMAFLTVTSMALVGIVPMAIWIMAQTMKAKHEDRMFIRDQKPQHMEQITDVTGETVRYTRRPPPYPYADREEKGPWWSAILLLLMLPPLGMCLVLYKLYQEPQNALGNSIVVRATGRILLGLAALLALGICALGASEGMQLTGLLVSVPGILMLCAVILILSARHVAGRARRLARLQSLIFVEGLLGIDDLAREMGLSYGGAVRLLQDHIDRRELFSCFLDFEMRTVVAPDQLPKTATRCRHCGGSTVHIRSIPALCRYCGRILR